MYAVLIKQRICQCAVFNQLFFALFLLKTYAENIVLHSFVMFPVKVA